MSLTSTTVRCCLALLGIAAATSAFLITHASPERIGPAQSTAQLSGNKRGFRNLALQPEALRVARQLGKRFGASSRVTSVLIGTFTVSGSEQPLTITRGQTETGEQINLLVGNRNLTWSAGDGAKATAGVLSDNERLLLERLTLDSPDQFVLAQLRGASYFTIARNVRAADAVDGYAGPLWDLVRLDEPPQNGKVPALSLSRIYYLNVQTGLPDRIEYQLNGQDIRVDFAGWTEQNGEKTPARIAWSNSGQTIMEYKLVSVSFNQ